MSVWGYLSGLIEPVAKVIDDVHTSDEERLKIKAELLKLQNDIASKVMDYEAKLFQAQADVIRTEAQGASWLQRSWRPITMLTFLALVVLDTMGLTAFRLSGEAWTLLQIGLGGYVVGRSVEKVLPAATQALKSKD